MELYKCRTWGHCFNGDSTSSKWKFISYGFSGCVHGNECGGPTELSPEGLAQVWNYPASNTTDDDSMKKELDLAKKAAQNALQPVLKGER